MDKLFHINESRDITIDVLRSIAFILIILVHIDPPNWIGQFAHFNVPICLLFISSWIIRFLVVFIIAITIYSLQYCIVTRYNSSFFKGIS